MDDARISFDRTAPGASRLTDEAFLSGVQWEPGARRSISTAAEQGDVTAFSRKLQKHGFGARLAMPSGGEEDEDRFLSLWSRGSFADTPHTSRLLESARLILFGRRRRRSKMADRRKKSKAFGTGAGERISRRRAGRLGQWLEAVNSSGHGPSPLEFQVLLELLLRAGRALPPEVLVPLWRTTLTAAISLSNECSESLASGAADDQRLMILGELPWEAGLLFSDVGGAAALRQFGRGQLQEQLEENTDTDGTPRAEILEHLTGWLAPLVRATVWSRRFGAELWDEEGYERFQELVRVVVPLCRPDGRFTLSNGGTDRAISLLTAASRLAGLKKKSLPRRYLLAVGGGRRKGGRHGEAESRKRAHKKRPPVVQSDWARVASLRSNWTLDADAMVVAYHRDMPVLELTALGRGLLSGPWHVEVAINGRPLQFVDQWTCTCWHSDEDADYLELQLTFESGPRIERQLLLSRTGNFVLLADAIAEAGGARIAYLSRLPVVEGIAAEPDVLTRQCRLKAKGLTARAFPLALPEDRVLSTPGEFVPAPGSLTLKQVGLGGLYAPLVIDWHPDHRRREAEWRTLTVSESQRVVKSDTASAHRVRIGGRHLVVYRSLRKPSVPRTFLGQHTSNETVVGRFDSQGEVNPIVLVE